MLQKEQKRTEGILRKIKIRWTERILLKAYNGWVSYLHSNQYNRHTLNVAKNRLANTLLFKSWNSWKSYVNGIKSKRSLIVGIMMKIPIKLRSMGFHRWRLVFLREKQILHKKRVVKRCLQKLSNRNASIALRTWSLHMMWHRKAERNSYKIMKRWRMLELHTAFTTYKTNVKQAIQDKALLRRAVQRIKYMRAHASLNQWIWYVDTRCRVRRILESYFGRQNMANSTKRLHRGWNLWCRYISKMKLSEMSADQKAAELKRQKALMKRMFSIWHFRATVLLLLL